MSVEGGEVYRKCSKEPHGQSALRLHAAGRIPETSGESPSDGRLQLERDARRGNHAIDIANPRLGCGIASRGP